MPIVALPRSIREMWACGMPERSESSFWVRPSRRLAARRHTAGISSSVSSGNASRHGIFLTLIKTPDSQCSVPKPGPSNIFRFLNSDLIRFLMMIKSVMESHGFFAALPNLIFKGRMRARDLFSSTVTNAPSSRCTLNCSSAERTRMPRCSGATF